MDATGVGSNRARPARTWSSLSFTEDEAPTEESTNGEGQEELAEGGLKEHTGDVELEDLEEDG